MTTCPVNAILLRYGNAQQQRDWLTPLARGDMLGAFCLTEPHTGSDASALTTRAERCEGGWRLNGAKQFISNGRIAKVAIVFAVSNPEAGKIKRLRNSSRVAVAPCTWNGTRTGEELPATARILASAELPAMWASLVKKYGLAALPFRLLYFVRRFLRLPLSAGIEVSLTP